MSSDADRLRRSLRATFAGLAANIVLTVAKLAAGIVGGSHALIADAVESMADILSGLIVWRGVVAASEPPDREHPYGHGKAEPLAAAVVSILLLLAAAGIIVKSSLQLTHPRPPPAVFTFFALLGVVVVKEALYRFVSREGESVNNAAVQADAWHHRSDAITSLAAAVGILVALVGGPRFVAADDAAAIIAGCFIAWNGWRLLRDAGNDLMDADPGGAHAGRVRGVAAKVDGVHRVEKCMVRKMGHEWLVDLHIEVDPDISVRSGHEIAHRVKSHVMASIPDVRDVLVHVEPGH